jgi:hypothetical protein
MTRYAKSHTQITVIIDTSEQGYNAAISSWRDMQNHTHTHRSCSQVVDLAARGHWTSSISVDSSNNWFLACNKTTKLPSLTCTFGLQEHSASGGRKHRKNNDHWTKDEGLFILKTMIIGHMMKLFILMPGGSGLPTLDTATRKKYVTRILLAAVLEGWATQSPLSQEFFYQLRDRGGGRGEKSKSLRPTRSILCAISRSISREEGSKCLALLYQKKEPYTS